MSRLTIKLDEDLHRALGETAAREGRSIASIIEESLRLRGIQNQARPLTVQARERARLDAGEAMALAVEETRDARRQ